MKRLILITGCILILSVIINAGIVPTLAEKRKMTEKADTDSTFSVSVTYVVKEYNGKIAVFEKGREEPYRTTDMSVNFLPEHDKELLINGIEVENQTEVDSVLEDYLS